MRVINSHFSLTPAVLREEFIRLRPDLWSSGAVPDDYGNTADLRNGASVSAGEITLDGIDDYLDFGLDLVNTSAEGAGGLTFAATLDLGAYNAGDVIAAFWLANGISTLYIDMRSGGQIRVGGRSRSADSFRSVTTSGLSLPAGEFHLAGVLDFAEDAIRVYVDGALVGSTMSAGFGLAAYSGTASTARVDAIGMRDDNSGLSLPATISNVIVAASAATDVEIAAIAGA